MKRCRALIDERDTHLKSFTNPFLNPSDKGVPVMTEQSKTKPTWTLTSGITALSLAVFGSAGFLALATPPPASVTPLPTSPAQVDKAIQNLEQSGQAFAAIAKKLSPAVVSLKVEKSVSSDAHFGNFPNDDSSNPLNDDLLKKFFGDRIPDGLRHQKHTSMLLTHRSA